MFETKALFLKSPHTNSHTKNLTGSKLHSRGISSKVPGTNGKELNWLISGQISSLRGRYWVFLGTKALVVAIVPLLNSHNPACLVQVAAKSVLSINLASTFTLPWGFPEILSHPTCPLSPRLFHWILHKDCGLRFPNVKQAAANLGVPCRYC